MGLTTAVLLVIVAAALAAASSLTGRVQPVTSLDRLLPPPEGKAYFGFTIRLWDTSDRAQGDSRPFSVRIQDSIKFELAGKTPTFLTVWAPWQYPDQPGKPLVPFGDPSVSDFVTKVESVTGAHSLLYLDWNLRSTTAQNGGVTTRDIASGALDGYIRQYARDLKAFADPVLVRLFGGEFNGSYGQSPRAHPNLTPADFVSAWRRVVDIFRQVGAANVSFAWIANTYPPEPVAWVDPDIASYYPGDAYVDWIGADTEDFAPPSWLDPIYAFALSHAKPFFLAEFGLRFDGSTLTPAQDQAWLGAMFDYFESHPDVKAINYFNYNSRPDHGIPWDPSRAVYLYGGKVNYLANVDDDDQRLLAESGADFRATYSRRIANPRYVSSILVQHIASSAQCLVPNVKGKLLAAARRAILIGHCRVRHIGRAYSAHVRGGRVISQQPRPGTRLKNGGRVDLVVSRRDR